MSVLKVFWQDPYLSEIDAGVTSVKSDIITLDKTIFYAFSGGQQSDSGTVGGYEVLKAEKSGMEIEYTIEPGHSLKKGDKVKVLIDWEKRYRLMRLHFAAELVLELVYQNYNRPEKIGANITKEKARVDFCWDGRISDIFPELKNKLDELIHKDLPVISAFDDETAQRRFWEIEGFAKVSCGGTHIKRTGEIGEIALKRDNLGKGKERIEIYLM
ncbi:MAG: alanyl-tRNA editing protein [Bacillota bacterium]|nr:alanyl-tRNA editing protein [Bacillota bacterium]